MKHVLSLGLLLSTAVLFGCAEESDGGVETTATGTDNTLVATTTTTTDGECKPGLQIGRCPNDIALPNSDGELVSMHALRGSRVAVVGAAEY